MKDHLIRVNNDTDNEYKYQKINGVKYYKDDDGNWFSLINGNEMPRTETFKDTDSSAYNYYKEAADFRKRIVDTYKLGGLSSQNAVEENLKQFNYQIFDFDHNIEEPDSDFNQHRLAVIRNSIEKNLSVAIANYNNYTNVQTDFLMPKLREDEWDKILNNISIISFMQGLDIGAKVYNGYAIVTNNNNEEVVTENSIYIANTADNTYHNVLEKGLNGQIGTGNNYIGIFNMDLNRKTVKTQTATRYYFPKLYYADYDSVVYRTNVVNLDNDTDNGNIYKYMDKNPNLAKIYYTALGRERYCMYKVNRNVQELLEKYMN